MSSPPVSLPPELHDIIIGFLSDDIPTLASCALVCKDWLPSSRCYLFRTLKLQPWNAQKFMRLLETPSHPGITPYVRELHIVEGFPYRGDAWFDEGLPLCLSVLRSVTSLYVVSLRWENLSGESWAPFMSFLHNIEELVIRNCHFKTFDQYTEVLCKPRSLRKLVVGDSGWQGQPTVRLDRLPCLSQVQALHLDSCDTLFLHWLMQHESCYSMLRILDARTVKAASVGPFGQFLRAIGPALESLTVAVNDRESPSICRCFNFHQSG
jgi:hypothetical protein